MPNLFEIHIIVDQNDTFDLFAYVKENKDGKIRPRVTCAQTKYGKHPNQPMLTFWKNGEVDDVVNFANSVAKEMEENFNLRIKRIKVEAMANSDCVPEFAKDDHYFEYHFKVNTNNMKEWDRLANLVVKYGVHLFFNSYSKTGMMLPVITMRHYHLSREDSLKILDNLVNEIKQSGFEIEGGIEKEYSVLDSNVYLDEGWLFENKPDNIIKHLQPIVAEV